MLAPNWATIQALIGPWKFSWTDWSPNLNLQLENRKGNGAFINLNIEMHIYPPFSADTLKSAGWTVLILRAGLRFESTFQFFEPSVRLFKWTVAGFWTNLQIYTVLSILYKMVFLCNPSGLSSGEWWFYSNVSVRRICPPVLNLMHEKKKTNHQSTAFNPDSYRFTLYVRRLHLSIVALYVFRCN